MPCSSQFVIPVRGYTLFRANGVFKGTRSADQDTGGQAAKYKKGREGELMC